MPRKRASGIRRAIQAAEYEQDRNIRREAIAQRRAAIQPQAIEPQAGGALTIAGGNFQRYSVCSSKNTSSTTATSMDSGSTNSGRFSNSKRYSARTSHSARTSR